MKWEDVTREERFFTCILYQDMRQNIEPLRILLQDKLNFLPNTKISDIGYEVCFFRDAYHANPKLIKNRQPGLEKQTFDLVLWLSDQSMILIEAKAQQGFHNDQLERLQESKNLMLGISVPDHTIGNIFLVGLYSSRYHPMQNTVNQFQSVIKWCEIARIYPTHSTIYERANSIYGD